MSNYPENDWRNYLMHSFGSHKYISKHRGKSGKWIYVYPKEKTKSFDDIISEIEAELPNGGGVSSTFNDRYGKSRHGGSSDKFQVRDESTQKFLDRMDGLKTGRDVRANFDKRNEGLAAKLDEYESKKHSRSNKKYGTPYDKRIKAHKKKEAMYAALEKALIDGARTYRKPR